MALCLEHSANITGGEIEIGVVVDQSVSGRDDADTSPMSLAVAFVALLLSSLLLFASTTPLLWTKGLQTSGIWPVDSPWTTNTGHIAFLDGHVEPFEGEDDNTPAVTLVAHPKSGATGTTNSINTAVASGVGSTTILEP